MYNINTNLKGRVRNTPFPKKNPRLPLFEAVVNSIQSIDSGVGVNAGEVVIKINRNSAGFLDLGDKSLPGIIGFEITDNGTGFDDRNFESFNTLDSELKIKIGCKGIGRLLWLKMFDIIHLNSVYKKNGTFYCRSFDFDIGHGIFNVENSKTESSELKTTVKLHGLKKEYEKYFSLPGRKIAQQMLNHCLWYFLREEGCPNIVIQDSNELFVLQDMYNALMIQKSEHEVKKYKNTEFEITNVRLNSGTHNRNTLVLCAASREVKSFPMQDAIPSLSGALHNEEGKPFYCYSFIKSKYLDDHVLPERAEFNLPEQQAELNFPDEISIEEILKLGFDSVRFFLKDYIETKQKGVKESIRRFVDTKAPQYKPYIKNIEHEEIFIDNVSDDKIDALLRKRQFETEQRIASEGYRLLNENIPSDKYTEYEEKLKNYLARASELKQAELARYVSHRRVILDFLKKAMEIQDDGRYSKERIIHNLIFPMNRTSSDVSSDANNLWVINERLAFHNYLASDKPLSEYDIISENTSKDRPDICSFQIFDNPMLSSDTDRLPLASINIIEFKRPMRNDSDNENDPIRQSLAYLQKIRAGKCKTKSGLLIPESDSIPGFCYIVADLTESLKSQCNTANLTITADKMGYFGYNQNYKAYIEVFSFSRLYSSALERNQAFFYKLGFPS